MARSREPLISTDVIYLAVSSSGSDNDLLTRPAVGDWPVGADSYSPFISSGDYTSIPYKTISGAVRHLPYLLRHDAFISLSAESHAGASISGIAGGSASVGLTINGAWSAVTPTTGVASGTAGSGTNSTGITKPTGAANWTASDLIGKFVKLTGGGGAGSDPTNQPVVRPIKSNTTSRITVDTVSGMDTTTTFEIVTPGSTITDEGESVCFYLQRNTVPVTIRGVKFSNPSALDHLIESVGNASLTLDGCLFDFQTSSNSIYSYRDEEVLLSNFVISGDADIQVTSSSRYVEGRALLAIDGAGPIRFDKCLSGKMQITADSNTGSAFRATAMQYLEVEASCDDCGATPIYLESISYCEAVGTNKLTGTGNTGYGVQIEKSGLYTLTGSTITGGTGDVYFMSNAVTWANMSSPSFGIVSEHAGSAVANSAYTNAIVYGDRTYQNSVTTYGRNYSGGYLNTACNLSIANLSTTTPWDAATNGAYGTAWVNSTNAGSIVVAPPGGAIAGSPFWVLNVGTHQTTLQASSGGSVTGTATIAAGSAALFVSLGSNSGKDYIRVS